MSNQPKEKQNMVDAKIGKKIALVDVELNARFEAIPVLINDQQIALVPCDIDTGFGTEEDTNEIEEYAEIVLKTLQSHFENRGKR